MTFGPGAVERIREFEEDLHSLTLAWLRGEFVEEYMGIRGTVFLPSVVVQHPGAGAATSRQPMELWLVPAGSLTPLPWDSKLKRLGSTSPIWRSRRGRSPWRANGAEISPGLPSTWRCGWLARPAGGSPACRWR
jgi:hypothetical protein